jgi:hypothetical protein
MQTISNGGRFKPAFPKRDKQTMKKNPDNWFKNQFCSSVRPSGLQALG